MAMTPSHSQENATLPATVYNNSTVFNAAGFGGASYQYNVDIPAPAPLFSRFVKDSGFSASPFQAEAFARRNLQMPKTPYAGDDDLDKRIYHAAATLDNTVRQQYAQELSDLRAMAELSSRASNDTLLSDFSRMKEREKSEAAVARHAQLIQQYQGDLALLAMATQSALGQVRNQRAISPQPQAPYQSLGSRFKSDPRFAWLQQARVGNQTMSGRPVLQGYAYRRQGLPDLEPDLENIPLSEIRAPFGNSALPTVAEEVTEDLLPSFALDVIADRIPVFRAFGLLGKPLSPITRVLMSHAGRGVGKIVAKGQLDTVIGQKWKNMVAAIDFDAKQIQKKFKHASKFGYNKTYSNQSAKEYEEVLKRFIQRADTQVVDGTFRKNISSIIFVNPRTKQFVAINKSTHEFISGWGLKENQFKRFILTGNIQ
ncbi:MAG: colicin D domain-containing protein [Vampirovibrionales bacterium]|nr:colicin D domain-containing protein [Vampirovibrionales bacterium]